MYFWRTICVSLGGKGYRLSGQIYQACNFQDITGQRIKKIVEALKYIDEKIEALALAVGHKPEAEPEDESAAPSDDDLLNGPQLPENAANQADIDALFD